MFNYSVVSRKMSLTSILALLVFSTLCSAGGDYSEVKILEFVRNDSGADFTVEFTNEGKYNENCDTFKVFLNYARVPWYSWMPLVRTSHPTLSETQRAIMYLDKAYKERKNIGFGYMGHGLKQTDKLCEYNSKGLSSGSNDEFQYVISFHDPV